MLTRKVNVTGNFLQTVTMNGLPTGTITDKWVEYLPAVGGSYIRANAIPVGTQCRFYVAVNANSGGGTSWSICITVIDLYDGVLKDWGMASVGAVLGIGGSVNISADRLLLNKLTNTPWIMPDHDLNLSFRGYASFDATPVDPTPDMYH
jgi:hypothetical protein